MRKLVLYIAMSLDGYIADSKGGIDFLYELPQSQESDPGYELFYETVDTIIMGNSTYRQVINELQTEGWVYPNKKCYVYSNTMEGSTVDIEYTNIEPKKLLENIRKTDGKAIWIVGGGKIIKAFMEKNLIDKYYIYVMPIVLGKGIPLFREETPKTNLKLDEVNKIGEIVEIQYSKK